MRKLVLLLIMVLMIGSVSCIGKTLAGPSVPDRPGVWLSTNNGQTLVDISEVDSFPFVTNLGLEPPACKIGEFDASATRVPLGQKLTLMARLSPSQVPDRDQYWRSLLQQKIYLVEQYERYGDSNWLRPIPNSSAPVTEDKSNLAENYIWLEYDISSLSPGRAILAGDNILAIYVFNANAIPLTFQ